MNETFSAHRLWLLLRGDFIAGWRSLLMISGSSLARTGPTTASFSPRP